MKKQEKNLLEDWKIWVILVLIVLLVYFYWSFGNQTNDKGYEKYCIDFCVSDIGNCAGLSYIVDSDGESWLYGWDFEDCFGELENCIDECGS